MERPAWRRARRCAPHSQPAAAELQAIIEIRRSELLAGQDAARKIDLLVRMESALMRKLERLGISDRPPPPPRLSLRERLQREANGDGDAP
jgi:hypothetical protein